MKCVLCGLDDLHPLRYIFSSESCPSFGGSVIPARTRRHESCEPCPVRDQSVRYIAVSGQVQDNGPFRMLVGQTFTYAGKTGR